MVGKLFWTLVRLLFRMPARVAVALYGPFSAYALPATLAADLGRRGPVPAGTTAVVDTADSVLPKLLTWRALLTLGLLALVAELALNPGWRWAFFDEWLGKALTKGLALMLVGPPVVFVVVLVLVAVAYPGERGQRLRAGGRPLGAAAFTLVLFAAAVAIVANRRGIDGLTRELTHWIDTRSAGGTSAAIGAAVVAVVFFVVVVWFAVFLFTSMYLVQRNAFQNHNGLPLLPPLVAIVVVWLYLWVAALWRLDPTQLTGWRLAVGRYGTPVLVTVLSIVEIVRLRRRFGIGFRGRVGGPDVGLLTQLPEVSGPEPGSWPAGAPSGHADGRPR